MNKPFNDILNSEQFKLSEELLNIRQDKELELEEMIEITELEPDYYLRLEAADISIHVSEYLVAISRVEQHIYNQLYGV